MSWTDASDLKAQLQRLWQRGDLLRPCACDTADFPLRLPLKGPGSAELAERFPEVRRWIAGLVAIPHIRLEWRELRHRVLGPQQLPHAAWLDSVDDAIALLGKRQDVQRFSALVNSTRASGLPLLAWLERRPLQALALAAQWPQLLAIVAWLNAHPRPGIYLRQVDIPGVHSKFIEAHRAVLAELLDATLPAAAIAPSYSGLAQFAARYGFLDKPLRLRFRILDPALHWAGLTRPDVTLDAASFAALKLPLRRVFITENETSFLAFPAVADAIVIFGAGYGWQALGHAQWLNTCEIFYWGDIDTHGFAILNQLRCRHPHVHSLLMDEDTLLAHEPLWGEEKQPIIHDLPQLTADEQRLFNALRDNRIREHLRLEQEYVSFGCLQTALAELLTDSR